MVSVSRVSSLYTEISVLARISKVNEYGPVPEAASTTRRVTLLIGTAMLVSFQYANLVVISLIFYRLALFLEKFVLSPKLVFHHVFNQVWVLGLESGVLESHLFKVFLDLG